MSKAKIATVNELLKEIKKLKKENKMLRESIEEYVSDIDGIANTAMEHFNDFVKTSQLSYLKSTLEDAIYREVYRVKDDVEEKLGL